MNKRLTPQSSPLECGEIDPAICEAALAEFDPSRVDFSTAVPRCTREQMNPEFVARLEDVAKEIEIHITCAYRSLEWDLAKGRSGKSSHIKGLAVDISTPNHLYRERLLAVLLKHGFTRIGIARSFIHVDADKDKVNSVWLYYPDNVNKTF